MTSVVDGTTMIRDLVVRRPQTRAVLERHGIDYCCGGGKSLAEAASAGGLSLATLTAELENAASAPPLAAAEETDWSAQTLSALVDHIQRVHHTYMKTALPRLRELVATVRRAHQARHGEMLARLEAVFQGLDAELCSHLDKEEQILFPYLVALERHIVAGAERPQACFPSARYPIGQMEHEHDSAGAALASLRLLTGGYALPSDACPTFQALYEELQRMERDLHQHIHLENNILFPRSLALEQQAG